MARPARDHANSLLALLLLVLAAPASAQEPPDLTGMWSDPVGLEGFFCAFWCSDAGLARLNELVDDPANDERPVVELYAEAAHYQHDAYVVPRLTSAAVGTLGLDPADDPGFLKCEPWAFARQIFAPHQLRIEQHADRVELLYGEWTARRTVRLGSTARRDAPPSPMGQSVGHYEGDTLVIETTSIEANLGPWGVGFPIAGASFDGKHSDALHVVERYARSDDGERLTLSATLEDPWALREPITLKKVWRWAPEQEIGPYENCEPPTEFSRGVKP